MLCMRLRVLLVSIGKRDIFCFTYILAFRVHVSQRIEPKLGTNPFQCQCVSNLDQE